MNICNPSIPMTSIIPFDCLYNDTRIRFRIEHLRDYHQEDNVHYHHQQNKETLVPHLCYSAILGQPPEEYYLPPSMSHFPVTSITGVSFYPSPTVAGSFFSRSWSSRYRRIVLKFSRGTKMELYVHVKDSSGKKREVKEDEAVVDWFTKHLITGREHHRTDWVYRFLKSGDEDSRKKDSCCWKPRVERFFARKYICGDFIPKEDEEKVEKKIKRGWLDFKVTSKAVEFPSKLPGHDERCA